ncbi:MAG: patatin-like phospholipase domain-containing protein, partial [Armatimonadota bacterium]|nr:patatin-like phospholipase domain-containing protein [Armatimonadota bacterium]
MRAASFSMFDGLSEENLGTILEGLPRRQFASGATVLAQGESWREIYVVRSGTADVFMRSHYGREHAINTVEPGAALGEVSLFTGQPISATVRATSDLEVLVLNEAAFYRSAAAFPRIYQNLGAILSQRLVLANRAALKDTGPRITYLKDYGAPPLLGYALACSVAWHTRAPTLLLVISADSLPKDLTHLAGSRLRQQPEAEPQTLPADGPQVHVVTATPRSHLGRAALEGGIASRCDSYDHVLVQVMGTSRPNLPERLLRLVGMGDSLPEDPSLGPGSTLRAWADSSDPAPKAGDQAWNIPALDQADEEYLRRGLFPIETRTGKLLGRVARSLSGLKIGLALGAGAEKGYAHVGVLQVLDRAGVPIDCITGTSIGSGMASMYAFGCSLDEMLTLTDRIGTTSFHLAISKSGFLSSVGIKEGLKEIYGKTRFADLILPLAVVAADLTTQQEIVFQRGLVWSA